MAISFDALPDTAGGNRLLPKGSYYAVIESAEMKTPKMRDDGTVRPDYLNLKYRLKDVTGKDCGVFWDILSESNNEWVLKKLKRFIIAVGIDLTGRSFELKDLCKPIVGTEFIVDIGIDERTQPHKNQIDLFSGDIYYHISEAGAVFGLDDVITPVNAADAEDIFHKDNNVEY